MEGERQRHRERERERETLLLRIACEALWVDRMLNLG